MTRQVFLICCFIIVSMVLDGAVAAPGQDLEKVFYDIPDETGLLSGGYVWKPSLDKSDLPDKVAAPCTTIIAGGDPANRIDLVCVGDGYLATEIDLYAGQVDAALAEFFLCEPFATYSTLFNVHRVDVVSNESGVDNDPTLGIERDTAMDMEFFCSNIERLLCVNVNTAYSYAENAPDVDQVLALANSTKYGGAGYPSSDLATFSGGNASSLEVALHEVGHSLGNLADEYYYYDGSTYRGTEPLYRNVSTLSAAEMAAADSKWAVWLGENDLDFNGLIDTYEGAVYKQYGVYRPTNYSKMRSLGYPFNLPSIEALLLEIYRLVDPIDFATPLDAELTGDEIVFVEPIQPVGHSLDVQWSMDGAPLPGATGTTLDLSELDLEAGTHTLAVLVVDNTLWVRDTSVRNEFLTDSRAWPVLVPEASPVKDHLPETGFQAANFPNPFNPQTVIRFNLPRAERVDVRIFDLTGSVVRTMPTTATLQPGWHEITWDGRDDRGRQVVSGNYFYRLSAGTLTVTEKMALLR